MTHITRVFNPSTRSLTGVERKYAGQVGDSISTVLHFEYTQLGFLSEYVPYIQFGVYDESGNQLIFGPMPENPSEVMQTALEDRVYFDGVEFTIPWSVTSRVKSARVDYQLFFVKVGVEFDGRNVAQLKPTEIVMSAIDSIALKPSITCDKRKPAPCCPPFAPTGAEPNVLGYIQLWKDYGIVVPVSQELVEPEFLDRFGVPFDPKEQDLIDNPPFVKLNFKTYSGKYDSSADLENVPVLKDGKILYYQLPYGNTGNTIPLLRGEIHDGKSIMYDADADGFVEYDIAGIYQFRGTCSSHDLDVMAANRQTLAGATLRNGDVYSLTDRRAYGFDELGDVKWYEAGTNWVWSEQEIWEPLTGDLDLNKYQLKSFRVLAWDNPTDEQYPSAKLTKDSLDAKLDDSQVITSWAKLDPELSGQNVQIPSAALVKETEDSKLDDSQVISSWDKLDPTLVGQDVQLPSAVLTKESLDAKLDDTQLVQTLTRTEEEIPSTKLLGEQLDLKTNVTMAIPNWDYNERYNLNSTVMYNGTIFISLIGGNTHSAPVDAEGNISEYWSMVQGGGGGEAVAQRWVKGDGRNRSITITHNYGSKDVFVVIREKATGRLVHATVTVVRPGAIRLDFSEPPATNSIIVTVSPAVPTVPTENDVRTQEFLTDTTEWRMDHNLGRIVTAQAFNQSGVELVGVVKQDIATLNTVTIEFNQPVRGTMVVR